MMSNPTTNDTPKSIADSGKTPSQSCPTTSMTFFWLESMDSGSIASMAAVMPFTLLWSPPVTNTEPNISIKLFNSLNMLKTLSTLLNVFEGITVPMNPSLSTLYFRASSPSTVLIVYIADIIANIIVVFIIILLRILFRFIG